MREPLHNPVCRANHLGLWAIEPQYLNRAVSAIKAGTWPARQAFDDGPAHPAPPRPLYTVSPQGIAVVQLRGAMMKGASKYAEVDTLAVRRGVREAAADERAKAILLVIDSPGGAVPGTMELAEDVLAADQQKPTYAFIEDLGASAAYWVASQARRVSVNAAGEVGSIGVYAVIFDESEAAKMAGVQVHVVATGFYKGAFTAGAPVLPEHLAYLQERVNDTASFFFDGVKAGRGLDDAELAAVADGRVFGAQEAKKLGLVDRVESMETTVAGILEDLDAEAARTRAARARARIARSRAGE